LRACPTLQLKSRRDLPVPDAIGVLGVLQVALTAVDVADGPMVTATVKVVRESHVKLFLPFRCLLN
jgi:uncharacterized lipoprotein YbaY